MNALFPETSVPESPGAADEAGSNLPEFSVSELSGALKKVVEQSFSHVRVRAEVGRVTFHGNGHIYLDLKDDKAVINGVVWRSAAPKLSIRPEQGLEVIATGRLTTFPGRSQYQIVIEQIEAAGIGALMALLEKRRQALAAEGLFDDARKKSLPYLPDVIGVVTSPTGAVIRDILHRLEVRFHRWVLLWPVMVQGEQAAAQVSAAVAGFNRLDPSGPVPRPDVLIVARGGGSIEDLWPFNEEAVVRAVAASTIPVISAVGHETDTTLIDFVSDRRAPTPTAAAEMAVPVRSDLRTDLLDLERRLMRGLTRGVEDRRNRLQAAARALPRADDLVAAARQRLDYASGRLAGGLRAGALQWRARLDRAAAVLRVETLKTQASRAGQDLGQVHRRLVAARDRSMERRRETLATLGKLLRSYSYQETLARGFALVRDEAGSVIRRAEQLKAGQAIRIDLADGSRGARVDGSAGGAGNTKTVPAKRPAQRREKAGKAKDPGNGHGGSGQGSLF